MRNWVVKLRFCIETREKKKDTNLSGKILLVAIAAVSKLYQMDPELPVIDFIDTNVISIT